MFSFTGVAQEQTTADDAVREAEAFIRDGRYGVKRECPEQLRRLDSAGQFDMQRHCRDYDASETTAFAASDAGAFFRVFFRKVPAEYADGRESFRVVEVFRHPCPVAGCVVLKDIELFLSNGSRILE